MSLNHNQTTIGKNTKFPKKLRHLEWTPNAAKPNLKKILNTYPVDKMGKNELYHQFQPQLKKLKDIQGKEERRFDATKR